MAIKAQIIANPAEPMSICLAKEYAILVAQPISSIRYTSPEATERAASDIPTRKHRRTKAIKTRLTGACSAASFSSALISEPEGDTKALEVLHRRYTRASGTIKKVAASSAERPLTQRSTGAKTIPASRKAPLSRRPLTRVSIVDLIGERITDASFPSEQAREQIWLPCHRAELDRFPQTLECSIPVTVVQYVLNLPKVLRHDA